MDEQKQVYLGFAILIICVAHIIRVFRWEILIETYEKPDGVRLTKSLALGYLFNYFLPFKVGDLGRALYAGTGMQNGRGFALATVIVERCLDILTVGVMFLVMALLGVGSGQTVWYYVFLAATVTVVLLVILLAKKYIKKMIYWFGGLFNEKFEEKVLRFFWALIWGFKDVVYSLPKVKLLLYTVIMWALYLFSYGAFSLYLETAGVKKSFTDVFLSLFDQKSLLSSGIGNGFAFDTEAMLYAIFMIVPLAIIAVVAIVCKALMGSIVSSEKDSSKIDRLNLIPQANVDERRAFLKMYFAGEKKEYIDNYLRINRNILVLRDYSAGSNATTILCTDGKESFYRKYAFGDAAKKLSDQIEWMKAHEDKLPIAEIIRSEVNDIACFYDMPYSVKAQTMFEYAQSGAKEKAWDVLKSVLGVLEEALYETGDVNDVSALEEYIDKKIIRNLDAILNSKILKELPKYKTVFINGVEYKNLSEYKELFSKDNLKKIFADDKVSDIHGDLTIENIVCDTSEENDRSFYLIDPNTGNVFNSKFIDYAKLLQSLHGNYEYLMAVSDVRVEGNRIDYKYVRSETYTYLYEQYKAYLRECFTESEIKSIYYHEIVNWLRLMPYKIEKGRGELFYAGLIMILDDVSKIS